MILILLIDIDVIGDIVDKNNNTHHSTTEMRPTDVNSNSDTEYNVDSNEKKILNLKMVIM